jgi:hypothetical protein
MEPIVFNDGLFTTDTKSLNQATINKMEEKLGKTQINAQSAMDRLIREGKVQVDFIAPIGKDRNQFFTHFTSNGHVKMIVDSNIIRRNELNVHDEEFTLHKNAVAQTAEKLNIPSGYLKQLSHGEQWERDLAAKILNEHTFNTDRKKVLVRAVGNEIRGILSDQYRRYDAKDIVGAFMTEVQRKGGVLVDGHMSDTKVFFEAIYPIPVIVPTRKNGDIALCFGARLSTSDFGDAPLEVKSYVMQTVCMNDMTRESQLKKVHLGSRLPENIQLSQRTYRKDTETMASAISDITSNIFDFSNVQRQAIAIQEASETEIDSEKQLKNLTKNKITKEEAYGVQKILNKSNPDDGLYGEGTLWKLTSALTAFARDTKPERRRELQEVAGSLIK